MDARTNVHPQSCGNEFTTTICKSYLASNPVREKTHPASASMVVSLFEILRRYSTYNRQDRVNTEVGESRITDGKQVDNGTKIERASLLALTAAVRLTLGMAERDP